jgi:PEGA domain
MSIRSSFLSAVLFALVALGAARAQAQPQPAAPPAPAPTAAPSAPAPATAKEKHKAAQKLDAAGSYEEALLLIEDGLALEPKNLLLLELKSTVQVKLRDYAGARDAAKRYVDAGGRRTEMKKLYKSLSEIQTTILEVTLPSGKASVYLRAKDQGVFCIAAPVCQRVLIPGVYPVIVEAEGYEAWNGRVTMVKGQTSKLPVTLVEKASLLTVRVTPPGATVTVDGAPHAAPGPIPAGAHKVRISLPGHLAVERDVTAAKGAPIDLELALVAVTPVVVRPAEATLLLDGAPVDLVEGGLVLAPGAHTIVARAPGLGERKVAIPATRAADYKIEVDLTRADVRTADGSTIFIPRRKIALAVGLVGAASFFGGVALGLSSSSLEDDAYGLCPRPQACPRADEANDLLARAEDRATYANIAYGVAGAAVAGAAVLWFTGAPEKEPKVSVTPRLGGTRGTFAGVDLSLRF